MQTIKLIIIIQIIINKTNKKIINANTNIIRKRKNHVSTVNEKSTCNNGVNKLKQG